MFQTVERQFEQMKQKHNKFLIEDRERDGKFRWRDTEYILQTPVKVIDNYTMFLICMYNFQWYVSTFFTVQLWNSTFLAARITQLQHVMKIDGPSKEVAKKEWETLQKKKSDDTQNIISMQAVRLQ